MDVCDNNLVEGYDEASTTILPCTRFEVEHMSYNKSYGVGNSL